jgi:hypothetical protein
LCSLAELGRSVPAGVATSVTLTGSEESAFRRHSPSKTIWLYVTWALGSTAIQLPSGYDEHRAVIQPACSASREPNSAQARSAPKKISRACFATKHRARDILAAPLGGPEDLNLCAGRQASDLDLEACPAPVHQWPKTVIESSSHCDGVGPDSILNLICAHFGWIEDHMDGDCVWRVHLVRGNSYGWTPEVTARRIAPRFLRAKYTDQATI